MTTSERLIGLVLFGALIVVGLGCLRPDPAAPAPDTVVVQRTAKAETVAVTTLRTVTNVRTRFDSIVLRDTLWQRDTVVRVVVESLLVACETCARELTQFTRFADSVIKSRDDSIAKLNRALASCSKQKPWYAAAGFGGCAVLTGVFR